MEVGLGPQRQLCPDWQDPVSTMSINLEKQNLTNTPRLEDGEWVDAELKDFQEEDERGEWAPAVVELDEDGREKGLMRF